jgi:hypothetical protein
MPTQNGLGLHEDDRPPPRRQPPRTEEQLQSIDEVELRALAVASQHVDLVAKHGVPLFCTPVLQNMQCTRNSYTTPAKWIN